MKNKFFTAASIIILAAALACVAPGIATSAMVGLEIRPASQTVKPGDSLSVDVFFVGDQYYAVSDISLTFDPAILNFVDWTPGPSILGYSPSSAFPMSESAPFTGNLPDPGSGLLLATVNFTALVMGTSRVEINPGDLMIFTAKTKSGAGEQYLGDISRSDAVVNVVPVPGALLLLASGLAGLAGLRKQFRQ